MIKHLQRLLPRQQDTILSKGHFFASPPPISIVTRQRKQETERKEEKYKMMKREKDIRKRRKRKGSWSVASQRLESDFTSSQGCSLSAPLWWTVPTSLQAFPSLYKPQFQVSVVVKWFYLLICLLKQQILLQRVVVPEDALITISICILVVCRTVFLYMNIASVYVGIFFVFIL